MSRRYNDIRKLYKHETGNDPDVLMEFMIWRQNGFWYIDIDDETAIHAGGNLQTYDQQDYIEWLEEKIMELENQIKTAPPRTRRRIELIGYPFSLIIGIHIIERS